MVSVQICFSVCCFGKMRGGILRDLEEMNESGLIALFHQRNEIPFLKKRGG